MLLLLLVEVGVKVSVGRFVSALDTIDRVLGRLEIDGHLVEYLLGRPFLPNASSPDQQKQTNDGISSSSSFVAMDLSDIGPVVVVDKNDVLKLIVAVAWLDRDIV